MRKFIITILILIGLGVVGYFGYQALQNRRQANSMSDLQTVAATQGSLTATVGATGVVRPDQTAMLAWETTGNVDQVFVEVGEVITTGQTLANLLTSSLPQNIILAQSDLITAQQQLDDLQNSQSTAQQALQAVNSSQLAVYQAEQALVKYDQQPYKDDLERAQEDVIDKQEDLDKAQEDFDPYKDRDPSNSTRQTYDQRLIDAQIAYDEAVRQVNLLELEQQSALANLDAANATLADAQRAYDKVRDGPNPDDITVLQNRIDAAEATLSKAFLAAPFTGTITEVDIKTGDQVSPGSIAFRLDKLDNLLVDVRVSEVDINSIQVGQPVNLTFDAILDKQYNGIVNQVPPVGDIFQGVVEFTVVVKLSDADQDVKPGMTAAVNIVVDQITNALLVPNSAVRVVDGQRVVYILENDQLKEVEVTLGASSDTQSQVIDGNLQVGDEIVLNPPQDFFGTNGGGPPFGMGG
jgi:HlyD family secretion protein